MKSVLKQVTLWTLIKTRRWEWVEELLAAQPARTLTLPALLDFSRGLYEESGVPRRHLRLARAVHEWDVERRDARSTRLLPVDLVEGSEVEALFRKVRQKLWKPSCFRYDDVLSLICGFPSSLNPRILAVLPPFHPCLSLLLERDLCGTGRGL